MRLPVVVIAFLAANVAAQTRASAGHGTTAAAQQAARKTDSGSDDQRLERVRKLYYSTSNAGLKSFDCSVHPDWLTLIRSSRFRNVTESDSRVAMMQKVDVTLHARMDGNSSVDWGTSSIETTSLDSESASMLNSFHQGLDQTLLGFMEFWTPFVDGSVAPDNAGGVEITNTDSGFTIHSKSSDAEVTETFAGNYLLEQTSVITNGVEIDFHPQYQQTAGKFLVNRFQATMHPLGAPAAQSQEMRVGIEYQTIDGFPIPARLNLEKMGTGIFNMVLDGCTVNGVRTQAGHGARQN